MTGVMSPTDADFNRNDMESRMMRKSEKRSIIGDDKEILFEPATGGCCAGKPCSIF
jgi:hypothetical protein